MTGYAILRTENVPEIIQNKPRWVVCILCTVSLVILTLSAVSAGVLIGYTYCYVENRSGVKIVNNTQTNGTQSYPASSNSVQVNDKTINEALFMLVQRILKIGHNMWDDNRYSLPWMFEKKHVKRET